MFNQELSRDHSHLDLSGADVETSRQPRYTGSFSDVFFSGSNTCDATRKNVAVKRLRIDAQVEVQSSSKFQSVSPSFMKIYCESSC